MGITAQDLGLTNAELMDEKIQRVIVKVINLMEKKNGKGGIVPLGEQVSEKIYSLSPAEDAEIPSNSREEEEPQNSE